MNDTFLKSIANVPENAKNSNVYTSEYRLYLPDKKELQKKLRKWSAEKTGGQEI